MTGMSEQDTGERRAANPEQTLGELCLDAMESMMVRRTDIQRVTVLHKGSIYFFDVFCVGVQPPYEPQHPELGSGDTYWFGQQPS